VAAVAGADPVRAAGGVVWRPDPGGRQTCLVHRSRYDDWSLPKGKLTPGEHPIAGALREVHEETGVRAVPQVRLPTVRYSHRAGAAKEVEYWLMRAGAAEVFTPNAEVDELRWVPLAEASELVSYEHDARLLHHAAALPTVSAVVLLVRHTYAGERAEWPGRDTGRPLATTGVAQAHALADLLALFGPRRLLAATPDRCRQSLEPLAVAADLPVAVDPAFDETAPTEAAVAALRDLAVAGVEPVVVCSQGKLIPRAVAGLVADLREPEPVESYATAKGNGWLLAFSDDRLAAADRVAPTPLS
jgi:8-oxo-dGTP pyrophosphatase MutT (NUDIX family)